MAGERAYPVLTYPDLDEAIAFFEALGFRQTFKQVRPYPCAVVELEDLGIHLSAVDGYDPAASLGSVIITVPDAEALHAEFAHGLRAAFGRVPAAGVPRLLRPRRKQGTTTGFTVVDVGGNWLRFYRAADTLAPETAAPENPATGLARTVEVAARQGDARGDDAQALAVLDAGLGRHPDAAPVDRVRALAYRAELLHRLGRGPEARATAEEAGALTLTAQEADEVRDDLAHVREVVGG